MGEFEGWHRAGGSDRGHFFSGGVSACGRYVDSQVQRGFPRGVKVERCGNCQKRVDQRMSGKKKRRSKARGGKRK